MSPRQETLPPALTAALRASAGRAVRIVCAGMPRSGSTWLYNAARLLLRAAGHSVYGEWIYDYDPEHGCTHEVLKIHHHDETLAATADRVLTSRRDPRDVVASLLKRGWTTGGADALHQISWYVIWHTKWHKVSNLEVVYHELMADQRRALEQVATALQLDLDQARLDVVLAQLEDVRRAAAGAERATRDQDPATLLHPKHIMDGRTGYYAEVVEHETVQEIERRLGTWLRTFGYLPAEPA